MWGGGGGGAAYTPGFQKSIVSLLAKTVFNLYTGLTYRPKIKVCENIAVFSAVAARKEFAGGINF